MGDQGEGGHASLCPAGTGGVRGEAAPLQAQLGLGPWTRNDDCLQVIPAPRDMHGAQPGRCTEACGQALRLAGKRSLFPCPGGRGRPSLRGEGATKSPAANPGKPCPCTDLGSLTPRDSSPINLIYFRFCSLVTVNPRGVSPCPSEAAFPARAGVGKAGAGVRASVQLLLTLISTEPINAV